MGEMTMTCKICGQNSPKKFTAKVLNKYDISYYHCGQCGFLQTEEPYWLSEAYSESITVSDTGILQRNQLFAELVPILLATNFNAGGKFVDFAGGYGIFTRLMRDIGFDFLWTDPMTKNLIARGFEYTSASGPIEALTTFETFEHLVDPLKDIESMLKISRNIIFSTKLLPDPVPSPEEWWYYVLEHGQHISFYSQSTLEFIARKYSLKFYSFGPFHLFTEKEVNMTMMKILFRFRKYGIRKHLLRSLTSRTESDFNSFRTGK